MLTTADVIFIGIPQEALGLVLLEYFGFLAISHFTDCSTHNHHHLSSRAGTVSQIVADVPSGLSFTPLPPKTLHLTETHMLGKARYSGRSPCSPRALFMTLLPQCCAGLDTVPYTLP
jgi:hypothetical protein